jgi:hypothetical protein
MRRVLAAVLLTALLAGCGKEAARPGPTLVPTTMAGGLGYRMTKIPVDAPGPLLGSVMSAMPAPPQPAPPPSQCDAPGLAYLVGHPRTDIPVPVDPSRRRVSCTTCPGADSYRPDRTDILFNADNGVITTVKCG